jgi:hypothetical protein
VFIDEEQYILAFIAEVLSHGQRCKRHAQAHT